MRMLTIAAGYAIIGALPGYAQKSSHRCQFSFSITAITQYKPPLHSPYNGQNSVAPPAELKTPYVSTLFSSVHPFATTTFEFDPKVAGGRGSTGSSFKLTLGKFSPPDFIDQNKNTNDSNTRFINWVWVNNGALDFAADTKGYTWGLAFAIDMLSKRHREYLAAGGSGFILGDGKLNYRPEFISELYYTTDLAGGYFQISPDCQLILNPDYNKDRGPISVFSLRLDIEI